MSEAVRRGLIAATFVILAINSREVLAQNAPAMQPPAQTDDPAFPPASSNPATANLGSPTTKSLLSNGALSMADQCAKEYRSLREEAERRGKLIKDASDRHAPADEACKLISSYAQAEIKMIEYVESHATACAIPASIADQLRSGHRTTEALQTKACDVARQTQQRRQPAGPVGDFDLGNDLHRQGY